MNVKTFSKNSEYARVVQLVERHVANVEAVESYSISRSEKNGWVAERLGRTLQKFLQRFKSAPSLKMDFENKYIDELIEIRKDARENKDWKLSDEIRNYLDGKLVFVFDTKDNEGKQFQEVHYLTEGYFEKAERIENIHNIKFKTKREFVEWSIKQDIQLEKRMDAWIYSMQSSK